MFKRISLLFAVSLTAHAPISSAADLWAKGSERLHETDETIDWSAPNGRVKVQSNLDKAELTMGTAVLDISNVMNSGLTEVNWSKDAQGMFINSSDGGTVGTWTTSVFVASGDGPHEVPVAAAIAREPDPVSNCSGSLNVMSVGWVDKGTSLLVVQQVPSSSGCKNMNRSVFYVVDLSAGCVQARLTPAEAMVKYRSVLGPGTKAIVTQYPNAGSSQ